VIASLRALHYAGVVSTIAAPVARTALLGVANGSFRRFAQAVLALNVVVIIWGAFVRASRSGDGCGGHWPFCNGQVIPDAPQAGTVIEYLHRLSSGAALLAVFTLCVWAWRRFPRGHQIRLFSALSAGCIVIEGALGAGLVLFGLVGGNSSPARAVYLSAHLTNTLLLLASLALTAWLAGDPSRLWRPRQIPRILWAALGIDLLVSVTGAIAALGDTLYPAESLSGGVARDFLATSSTLLRLRLVHPLIAAGAGLFLLYAGIELPKRISSEPVRKACALLVVLVLIQVMAGAVNVWLLAPVWMQLAHLFIGSLLWIVLVVLTAESAGSSGENELARVSSA
jgi:heme a synthase